MKKQYLFTIGKWTKVMDDVNMEMDQVINLATWHSQGENCTKVNVSNMCNLDFKIQNTLQLKYLYEK